MAKSTCWLALFVAIVVSAEAIRIDPSWKPSPKSREHFPSIEKADPRCKGKENGLYPYPKDCTKYIKCVNGNMRIRKCPEDFKFDSIMHCVPPDEKPKPDCGKPKQQGPVDVDQKCPDMWGMFPVEGDCRKYIICREGRADIRECPTNYVYRDINGCIPGLKCPDQASEGSPCKKANGIFPDEKNCRRYFECVNFLPTRKECPVKTAFDPREHMCTEERLKECRNDIRNVGQDE